MLLCGIEITYINHYCPYVLNNIYIFILILCRAFFPLYSDKNVMGEDISENVSTSALVLWAQGYTKIHAGVPLPVVMTKGW